MKPNLKHLLSLEYLKPTWLEKMFFITEIRYSIFCGYVGYKASKGNIFATIGSVLIPQITTYLFFRTAELYLTLKSDNGHNPFWDFKSRKIFSKSTDNKTKKTIDDTIENT